MPVILVTALGVAALPLAAPSAAPSDAASAAWPGSRVLMDAHNCYPYHQEWSDRIERALAAGAPLAIEQDLAWYTDRGTGAARLVLSHSATANAADPTLDAYFFERIRPQVEAALAQGDRGDWPLITLNLDFKSQDPAPLRAMAALLRQYQGWLTTAPRTADVRQTQPLEVKPILVLAGAGERQRRVFYDDVPVGGRIDAFGAVDASAPPLADNYHRWINHAWGAVETGGPAWAGFWSEGWSAAKQARLDRLVRSAHQGGLWIRFYSLDGASRSEARRQGWSAGYNFGSAAAVEQRWRAAQQAGVDYIASDQYQALAQFLKRDAISPAPPSARSASAPPNRP